MPPPHKASAPLTPSNKTMPQVRLKPRKARPFFGRHPWVLDAAIAAITERPADGDVVDLVTERNEFIARGILNSRSRIRVRLYTWHEDEALDAAFWQRRIAAAVELRRQLGYLNVEGACRLVNNEADGLGGLIVDRYGPYLVVHVTALAIERRLDEILPILIEVCRTHGCAPRGILVRADEAMAKREGLVLPLAAAGESPRANNILRTWGELPTEAITIDEHGLRYGVDLLGGQKTGFFLDQRENRRIAASYMRDRTVLDVCCYTGGFSMSAAKLGGAREVLGIDTSARAVALATANAELNGLTNFRFETGDAFKTVAAFGAEGRKFGAVVLDPPKFAANRTALPEALRAYERLNVGALNLLEPGGILVTCSCTGAVTREDFVHILAEAAARARRPLQILEGRGPAPDHPFSVSCLETEYLKCFICRVG
ncbi:MAG: class I SAM-dependent rRNA methyltransferase [Planctomycetia bacterium]|nr:class I SAM-dependent rRNA methyltransferase [Planctomycetia bacterium]